MRHKETAPLPEDRAAIGMLVGGLVGVALGLLISPDERGMVIGWFLGTMLGIFVQLRLSSD